ncbi:MAG: DUF177 domain-containing protein [Gammaproteobacteria bacterium]
MDYRRLLADGGWLSGEIAASDLARVGGNFRLTAPVSAELRLRRDDRGRVVVEGTYTAGLEARCQRCLEWMRLELRGQLDLVLGDPDIGPPTLDDEDLVLVSDGKLAVWDLIEDELLLGSPMIPLHPERDCAGREAGKALADGDARHKPFAALGAMLDARRDEDF